MNSDCKNFNQNIRWHEHICIHIVVWRFSLGNSIDSFSLASFFSIFFFSLSTFHNKHMLKISIQSKCVHRLAYLVAFDGCPSFVHVAHKSVANAHDFRFQFLAIKFINSVFKTPLRPRNRIQLFEMLRTIWLLDTA